MAFRGMSLSYLLGQYRPLAFPELVNILRIKALRLHNKWTLSCGLEFIDYLPLVLSSV